MTVTLAPEAQSLLTKAGGKWPDADEDHILDMADSWKDFGRQVSQIRSDGNHSVQAITGINFGESIDAFEKWWLENADAALGTLESVADAVDSILAAVARAVLAAKKAILGVLEWAAKAIDKAEGAAGDIPVIGGLVKDALEDVLEPIFNAVRHAVEDIVNTLADTILTAINDVLRTLIGLLKDAIDAFRKLIKAAEHKLDDAKKSSGNDNWKDADGDPPDPDDIHLNDERRRHILDGDATGVGHRSGTGKPHKTEFPAGWSDDECAKEVEDVAKNPDQTPVRQRNGRYQCRGERNGVEVVVIVDPDGNIRTAYPAHGKGVMQNDASGHPHPKP